MHLKLLSAYIVCCAYLLTLLTNEKVEANSEDPDQTVTTGESELCLR